MSADSAGMSYRCPVCKAVLTSCDYLEGLYPLVAPHSVTRTEFDRDLVGIVAPTRSTTTCPMAGEPLPLEFPW